MRNSAGSGYKYNLQGVLLETVDNLSSYDEITDFVAKGDGYNLNVRHLTLTGCVIADASSPGPTTGRRLVNVQPDLMRSPNGAMYGHLTVPDRPTNAMLAASLLSKTNPSRPVVDLPTAIWELRELPELLHKEGGGWIRKLASTNLKYQFGIKPLVSDVIKLLSFADEVDKRQRELERLQKHGLRRTRHLWSGSTTGSSSGVVVHSANKFSIELTSQYATQLEVSGFVEWKLNSLGRSLMKGDQRALAKKAVLGLTIDFATAWNALPWSWLVDWCGNVGDILIANRNIVGATHGSIQIMDQTTTTGLRTFPGDPYVSSGRSLEVSKQRRTVVNVPVSAQLPVLNARQLSILGSIGVTRRVPSHL